MNKAPEHISEDLFQLLGRIKRVIDVLAEEQKLTHVQMVALHVIDTHGALAMGQTAHVLHCDASNVTGLVDRLVVQGLVERQENEHDRRTKTLRLTAKGEQVVSEVKTALPARLGWDSLTSEEQTVLHAAIRKFLAHGPA